MPIKLLLIKADLSFLFAIKLQNKKKRLLPYVAQGFLARVAPPTHCPRSSTDLDEVVGSLEVICPKPFTGHVL